MAAASVSSARIESKPITLSRRKSQQTENGAPDRIGRFQIIQQIGRGGMGVVFKALDPETGNMVAIKRLRRDRINSKSAISQFGEEAERMFQFDHPNILIVIEEGEERGVPFYVMRYIDGASLDEYVREVQGGVEWILGVIYKISLALEHIHERGWIHRDVKPSNILIDAEGEPYLTDFGICRPIMQELNDEEEDETAGTPLYMAPEQILAPNTVDQRSDVYVLGIVMYELLTGVRPFRGQGTEDVLSRILFWEPISPRMLCPTIPAAVEKVIMKAMDKSPKNRYQSSAEMAQALKSLMLRVAINRRIHPHETSTEIPAINN
jgi:serine/threonine protein kinase